jgi:hypothetical protein
MTWRQQPAIWQVEGLAPTAKLVLLALAFFSNSQGAGAYPAQATIATMCGVSIPTVKRCLRVLRNRHLIEPEGKGRKGVIKYRIALPLSHKGRSSMNGAGRSRLSYNPVNKYPINKNLTRDSININSSKAIPIDKFSTTLSKDSAPPEPGWKASVRVQNRKR